MIDLLSHRSLNCDHKFALLFSESTDVRDSRSLSCDGRIVIPVGVKDAEYPFGKCQLLQKSRTEFASQVNSANLQLIEDICDIALPSTTDADGTVNGASKAAHIGQDAMEKLLDGVWVGTNVDARSALLVWEVNAGWGQPL